MGLESNGTFETNVASWESNGVFGTFAAATFARSTLRAHGGVASLEATWPTTGGGNPNQSWVNHVSIPTINGRRMRFSAWMYVPTGSPNVRLEVVFMVGALPVALKDQWVQQSIEWVADGGGAFCGMRTDAGSTAGTKAYLDDVLVEYVVNNGTGAIVIPPVQITELINKGVSDIRIPAMALTGLGTLRPSTQLMTPGGLRPMVRRKWPE